MAKDQYIERLQAVPIFHALSRKELGIVLKNADHLRYGPGHKIVVEGRSGEEFWLVIDGELEVQRGGRTVDTLGPGDFFGELAVIDPAPRDATVVSRSDVELMLIERRRFWAILEEVPTLSRKVLVGLARRVRVLDARSGSTAPS